MPSWFGPRADGGGWKGETHSQCNPAFLFPNCSKMSTVPGYPRSSPISLHICLHLILFETEMEASMSRLPNCLLLIHRDVLGQNPEASLVGCSCQVVHANLCTLLSEKFLKAAPICHSPSIEMCPPAKQNYSP